MASTQAKSDFPRREAESLGSLSYLPPSSSSTPSLLTPRLSDLARLPRSFHASRVFLLSFDVIWEARSGPLWSPLTTALSYEPTTMSFDTAVTVPSCAASLPMAPAQRLWRNRMCAIFNSDPAHNDPERRTIDVFPGPRPSGVVTWHCNWVLRHRDWCLPSPSESSPLMASLPLDAASDPRRPGSTTVTIWHILRHQD